METKYLSEGKVSAAKAKVTLSIIFFIAAGFTGIMLIIVAVLMIFTATAEEALDPDTYTIIIIFGLFLLVAAGLCGKFGSQNADMIRKADIYAKAFKDSDGIIGADDVEKLTGRNISRALAEAEPLIRNGILINCALRKGTDPGIMVAKKGIYPEDRTEYFVIRCPYCGGNTEYKKGAQAVCGYCGSAIEVSTD
ncbi:MAG: hypothetical protein J6I96_00525 [Oscillospiraceae bacterium]|nr:hypothetical protein [Oscillospiraceae bacterium]